MISICKFDFKILQLLKEQDQNDDEGKKYYEISFLIEEEYVQADTFIKEEEVKKDD